MHGPGKPSMWVPAWGWSALFLTGCSVLTGCSAGASTPVPAGSPPTASSAPLLAKDVEALRVLGRVAPASLDLRGGRPVSTDCWTPSRHLFDDPSVAPAGTWKVLCRVRYTLDGERRYQDATCIGDFDAVPMLDHCYVWEYYTDEPRYRDGSRLASAPPTPLP